MRALILGAAQRDAIQSLRAHALLHPTDALETLQLVQTPDGLAALRKAMNAHTIDVPRDYRVTFTITKQPAGLCRHIAISIDHPTNLPSPHAVQLLMIEFGFVQQVAECFAYIQELDDRRAINVLELIRQHAAPTRVQ